MAENGNYSAAKATTSKENEVIIRAAEIARTEVAEIQKILSPEEAKTFDPQYEYNLTMSNYTPAQAAKVVFDGKRGGR